jgi:hypothetical protein
MPICSMGTTQGGSIRPAVVPHMTALPDVHWSSTISEPLAALQPVELVTGQRLPAARLSPTDVKSN